MESRKVDKRQGMDEGKVVGRRRNAKTSGERAKVAMTPSRREPSLNCLF
jgi:hypothetical protein